MDEIDFYIDGENIFGRYEWNWYHVEFDNAWSLQGRHLNVIQLVCMRRDSAKTRLSKMLEADELEQVYLIEMRAYGFVAMSESTCYQLVIEKTTCEAFDIRHDIFVVGDVIAIAPSKVNRLSNNYYSIRRITDGKSTPI